MTSEEDLEMMLSFIRRMIDCMDLRLLNIAVFLGKPLGKWPDGDDGEYVLMMGDG